MIKHYENGPPEFVLLLDQIEGVLFWLKDLRGNFSWVNLPFALYFGRTSRDQVVGCNDFDVFSLAYASQYRLDDDRVVSSGQGLSRVELIEGTDKESRWHVTSKMPFRDHQGRLAGTAGTARSIAPQDASAIPDIGIGRAARYMSEHLSESITNEHLAQICGSSVRTLERRFRSMYGMAPHNYLKQMRVAVGCRLLNHSHRSLALIATELGFADQSHFTREFRKALNETPHAYRERVRRKMRAPDICSSAQPDYSEVMAIVPDRIKPAR